MFKPSDIARTVRRPLEPRLTAGAALVALLALPMAASSGVTAVESREAPKSAAYAKDAKPSSAYQMRCWQQGKLLFEEQLASLPADGSRYTIKVAGNDRYGRPVYVAETSTATCLIRSSSAPQPALR